MTLQLPHGELRTQAAALARAAAWAELASLLGEHADDGVREVAELVTLRAESLMRTGQPREARGWLADTLPELARTREHVALRRATNLLGAAHFALGELEAAREAFERALELGQEDEDDLTVARATNNLGAIANVRGRREQALALYQLAIPAYQRLGNALGLAQSFHNMAITFRDLGQLGRADECERRAIEFGRQAGSAHVVALAQLGRADLSLRGGDAVLAEAGARHAARSFAELGDPINQADALRVIGAAVLAQGRHEAARVALDSALALARAHGSALHEAEARRGLAELHAAAGDPSGARAHAEAALHLFERLEAATEADELRGWIAGQGGD
ncbi:MAG TPA: tetratricopeptide repeat protein [Gemmatimonadaceae bacterium]|nr:tetratricopeptide repeat protein [Gemmatimonadaceae bacterium]